MTTEIISRYKLISSNLTPENVDCRYYYTTSSSSTTLIHVIGDFHVDSHYNVVFVNEPYATARQSLDSIRTFFFSFFHSANLPTLSRNASLSQNDSRSRIIGTTRGANGPSNYRPARRVSRPFGHNAYGKSSDRCTPAVRDRGKAHLESS